MINQDISGALGFAVLHHPVGRIGNPTHIVTPLSHQSGILKQRRYGFHLA